MNSHLDPDLAEKIVYEVKSQGLFDEFRRDSISDVDTKPAYQNLRQLVENAVRRFLAEQKWSQETNKYQLRERMRKHIEESGFLDVGVERIVDQVVNPKINTVFKPKIEEVAYRYLGIPLPPKEPRPEPPKIINPLPPGFSLDKDENELKVETDADNLLPTDLEQVSPDSDKAPIKDEFSNGDIKAEDDEDDDDESPPFEPIVDFKSPIKSIEENGADDVKLEIGNITLKSESPQENINEKSINVKRSPFGAKLSDVQAAEDATLLVDSQLSQVSSETRMSTTSSDVNVREQKIQPQNVSANMSEEAQMPKFSENSNESKMNVASPLHFDIKKDEIKFEGTDRNSTKHLEDYENQGQIIGKDSPKDNNAIQPSEVEPIQDDDFRFSKLTVRDIHETNAVIVAQGSNFSSSQDDTSSAQLCIVEKADDMADTNSSQQQRKIDDGASSRSEKTPPEKSPQLEKESTKEEKREKDPEKDRDKEKDRSKQSSSSTSSSTSKHHKKHSSRDRKDDRQKSHSSSSKDRSSSHHKSSKDHHSTSSRHHSSSSSVGRHSSSAKSKSSSDHSKNKINSQSSSSSRSTSHVGTSSSTKHRDDKKHRTDDKHHSSSSSSSRNKSKSTMKDDHDESREKSKHHRRKSSDSNDDDNQGTAGSKKSREITGNDGNKQATDAGNEALEKNADGKPEGSSNATDSNNVKSNKDSINSGKISEAKTNLNNKIVNLSETLINPATDFVQIEMANRQIDSPNSPALSDSTEDLHYFEEDPNLFDTRLQVINQALEECCRTLENLEKCEQSLTLCNGWLEKDESHHNLEQKPGDANNNDNDNKRTSPVDALLERSSSSVSGSSSLSGKSSTKNGKLRSQKRGHESSLSKVRNENSETQQTPDSPSQKKAKLTSVPNSELNANCKENDDLHNSSSHDVVTESLKQHISQQRGDGGFSSNRLTQQQRYSSEDLYKPRPILSQRSRRRGGLDLMNLNE